MASRTQSPEKFRRYRSRLKARGLRQIQLWVPDTTRPEFTEELRRQIACVEATLEDSETLDFIEQAADWDD